jgi:PAS domain-containing protein
MPDRVGVSSADFVRNIGYWQEQALKGPISITNHGRERFVLVSADRYNASNPSGELGAPVEASNIVGTLGAVLDNVTDGFLALAGDLTITAANRIAEAYLGLTWRQVEGRALTQVFPSIMGSVFLEQIQRVLQVRECLTFVADSLPFEGRRVEFRIFPLPQGVGVLFVNLADRDALEARAARAAAFVAGISIHPGIGITQCDAKGCFTRVDDAFADWVRFEPSALLKSRLTDIVVPADRRRVTDALMETVTTRKPVLTGARLLARDLNERNFTISLSTAYSDSTGIEVFAIFTEPLAPVCN